MRKEASQSQACESVADLDGSLVVCEETTWRLTHQESEFLKTPHILNIE